MVDDLDRQGHPQHLPVPGKLLTILNAMMRTQTTWQQLPHPEGA